MILPLFARLKCRKTHQSFMFVNILLLFLMKFTSLLPAASCLVERMFSFQCIYLSLLCTLSPKPVVHWWT